MIRAFMCLIAPLLACGGQACCGPVSGGSEPSKIAPKGDSVLDAIVLTAKVHVVISTSSVEIGLPGQTPPAIRKTNCTYSRYPCSQVTNLAISIDGNTLHVPRSVFADCADVGSMALAAASGLYVLAIVGGDASESYTVKVFFDKGRVRKRELYANEAQSLLETTTYSPPVILD